MLISEGTPHILAEVDDRGAPHIHIRCSKKNTSVPGKLILMTAPDCQTETIKGFPRSHTVSLTKAFLLQLLQ